MKTRKPRVKLPEGWSWFWRVDRRIWETVCPHGVGHCDATHGCDGCCSQLPWYETYKRSNFAGTGIRILARDRRRKRVLLGGLGFAGIGVEWHDEELRRTNHRLSDDPLYETFVVDPEQFKDHPDYENAPEIAEATTGDLTWANIEAELAARRKP